MSVCVAPGSEARLGKGEAAHAWSMSAMVLVAGNLRGGAWSARTSYAIPEGLTWRPARRRGRDAGRRRSSR
jgi:hypothetical protein